MVFFQAWLFDDEPPRGPRWLALLLIALGIAAMGFGVYGLIWRFL